MRWRDYRASQLGSLALFVPESSPDTGNPFLQQPVDKAHDTLDAFNEIYFGLGLWPLPVRGRFELMLAGDDAQAASRLASEFQTAVDASRQQWGEQMPTVARLHDVLSVEAQDGAMRLTASFDRDWVDALAKIPQEIINLISAGSGLKMTNASTTDVQERIDEAPACFLPAIDSADLPPCQAEPPFLAEADTVSGPFGIRLDFGASQPTVIAVNAYNAAGDAIWVPHPELKKEDERWLGVFPTHGAAGRIEVLLAAEVEEARYPFVFSVGQGD